MAETEDNYNIAVSNNSDLCLGSRGGRIIIFLTD